MPKHQCSPLFLLMLLVSCDGLDPGGGVTMRKLPVLYPRPQGTGVTSFTPKFSKT